VLLLRVAALTVSTVRLTWCRPSAEAGDNFAGGPLFTHSSHVKVILAMSMAVAFALLAAWSVLACAPSCCNWPASLAMLLLICSSAAGAGHGAVHAGHGRTRRHPVRPGPGPLEKEGMAAIRCLKRYVAREAFAALRRSQFALDNPGASFGDSQDQPTLIRCRGPLGP
jgi:hypothetical protein